MYGLAFSPDGTRLAIGSGDNTIRLWDVASRQEVCQLRGHDSYVHAVAFSPDGTRLASASGDADGADLGHRPAVGAGAASRMAPCPHADRVGPRPGPIVSDGRPTRPVGSPR